MSKPDLLEMARAAQVELARRKTLGSTLTFTQYFFDKIKKEQFIVNEHHRIICDVLDRVFKGELTRVIINVAPRYTKTELAVKNFIAKGIAHNPKAMFIHSSYSDNLALNNSDSIREVCKDPAFQELFPAVQISNRSDSKKMWSTTLGGGVYATAAAGQVTGFGAGIIDHSEDELTEDEELRFLTDSITALDAMYLEQEGKEDDGKWKDPYADFAGAIVFDDPIKPEDAKSEIKRKQVNERFESTFRNRVNSKKTPIIITHQRIHEMDLTGYLLSQEPGVWTVITLPCLKEDGTALWPLKHTIEDLLHIKKVSPYVFQSQYQQDPKPIKRGGEFYKLFEYNRNVIKNPINRKTGLPILYDPEAALHFTYDFNYIPYLSIGVWQVWGKKAIKIDEIAARSPINKTGPASRELLKRYITHKAAVFIYGDPSGIKEDTRTEKGSNDFTIIMQTLAAMRPHLRRLSKAPNVSTRGNFMNTLFVEGYEGIEIFIGDNCVESINDFQFVKEDADGTKLKEKEKDEGSQKSFEKYGHFSDGDDYFICTVFANAYAKYQNGPSGKMSSGKAIPSKNSY